MRIKRVGKITDDFYTLGNGAVPIYLLKGPVPALFDAGFTVFYHLYKADIQKELGNRAPAYLFLTHSHFDHVGSAGYLKREWPDMKVCGSERASEILSRPGAIELITELNEQAGRVSRSWGNKEVKEIRFEPFDIDRVLVPDEIVDLGSDCTVHVISTPGHTWDFLSYWIPEKKILVASEAVGCDDGSGDIVTEFLVDYDAYRDSMKRLSLLDVEVLCIGHQIVLTGPDAGRHIRRSIEQAEEFVSMVEGFLTAEGGDIEKSVARVKSIQWDPKPLPKQPEPAYLLNTRARVEKIWERMQQRAGS